MHYRHNALAIHTVGNFSWPDAYRPQALEAIAPILETGDDAALDAAFEHPKRTKRGALSASATAQFLAIGTSRVEPQTAAHVLHHIPLSEGFVTALELGEEAHQSMVEAIDVAPGAEVAEFVATVPAMWATRTHSSPADIALLSAVASRQEAEYVDGAVELVTDFLASDDSGIVPERLGEIVEACRPATSPVAETIASNLGGAAHEVLTATRLLPAVEHSVSLDEALANRAAEALRDWSRVHVDRDVATRIAEAVRHGSASRSAALKIIGPGGPRKEPAKSIYLAVRRTLLGT